MGGRDQKIYDSTHFTHARRVAKYDKYWFLFAHPLQYRLASHFVTNLILMNQLNNPKAKETKTGFPFQF